MRPLSTTFPAAPIAGLLPKRLAEEGRQPLPVAFGAHLVIDAVVRDRPAVLHADIVFDDVIDLGLGLERGPVRTGRTDIMQPLSQRELEVAALIETGLSNREIAQRLVIAKRTADGHVERILAKLGFTSRAQVAAWMARRTNPDL